MKLLILVSLLSLFSVSCSHTETKGKANITVINKLKGHSYGPIYFSAQPSKKDLSDLKANGFAAVINLRGKKEKNYSEAWERKIVNKQGVAYYNVPFSMKKEMNDHYIDTVTSKIMKHRENGKVLVHCSSGNRVAVWVGGHFLKDHKYSREEAMKIAEEFGLTSPKAKEKLQSYLDIHQ